MEVQAPPDYQPSPTPAAETIQADSANRRRHRPQSWSGWRGYRIGELILLSVSVVDAFLALDFVFRAGATSHGGFVSVVDRVGGALASPFAGIFRPGVPQVGHTTYWAALLALVVYTVAAMVLLRLMHLVTSPRRHRPAAA